MKEYSLEEVAAILVRAIGIVVVIYSFIAMAKSPALMERSIGQDRNLDMGQVTFVIGKKSVVLSPIMGKVLIIALYQIPVLFGIILVVFSRFWGKLLCLGIR